MDKSLGDGLIGTEETVLYTVSNNSQARTSMLTFVNVSGQALTLNVYKKVNGNNYPICPNNLILLADYSCQEDGPITLNTTDSLVATCSIDGGVSYMINGEESLNEK